MVSYRKLITSIFILTLFICQSGVCNAAIGLSDNDRSVNVSHSCHDMADSADHGVNPEFPQYTSGHNGDDCCLDGTINSRDTGTDLVQLPVVTSYFHSVQNPVPGNHKNYITHNKGHPPGVPVFMQKSSLII